MTQDASLSFQVNFGQTRSGARHSDEPEEIVVVGAFSGASAGAATERLPVSLETLDGLMHRLAPRIQASSESGAPLFLDFYDREHLHPDSLADRWPPCAEWRHWLRQLEDPATRTLISYLNGARVGSLKYRLLSMISAALPMGPSSRGVA